MKLINDPIHGFIRLDSERVLAAIAHPIFQRLRRISQLGLAQMVYPNATHTRFAHALGVMHLMSEALQTLSQKVNLDLSPQTREAALLAALLHDIGHAPFSHSLEGLILPYTHEVIGLALLSCLEHDLGDLTEVRALLTGSHPKTFLCQLLQGPLDVDRLDYLVRDSFFTGVQEGIVGTQRIIYTLTCTQDDQLAVEEKGLASVEKFLLARQFMYWQVYLHKTVLASEIMLQRWWEHFRQEEMGKASLEKLSGATHPSLTPAALEAFLAIDEPQIWTWIRLSAQEASGATRLLAKGLLERKLYKIQWGKPPNRARLQWERSLPATMRRFADVLWVEGVAQSKTYEPHNDTEIYISTKTQDLTKLSEMAPWLLIAGANERPYWGYLSADAFESTQQ